MKIKIKYNNMLECIKENENKYKEYKMNKLLNQEKFNEFFDKILNNKKDYKILIYTDHDSDGIHSGLILSEAFNNLGINYYWHISSRKNGYGLHEDVLADLFMKEDFNVLITADLGITNNKEIEFVRDNWNPIIIITDHHTIQEDKYPKDADVIINPKLSIERKEEYLCGAGVVYHLIKDYFCNQSMKIWAMIATIGDMVPLYPCSENRNIVIEGLKIINKERIENNQIRFMFENMYGFGNKIITEMDIAFNIVPMINSLSRYFIENTIKDYYNCSHGYNGIYKLMKDTNDTRKSDQKELESIAKELIQDSDVNVIVMDTDKKSLLGLVSSYIANNFNKSNIVIAKSKNGYSGSGRSNGDVNMFEMLQSFPNEWFNSWGGHVAAVGINIKNEYVDNTIQAIANFKIKNKKDFEEVIELNNKDFDELLIPTLSKLAPFGEGNPQIKFLIKNMEVEKIRTIKTHCFITASFGEGFDNNYIEVLYFNFDKKLSKKNKFDAIGTFDINKNFYVEKILKIE